jgi:hypothetical protein
MPKWCPVFDRECNNCPWALPEKPSATVHGTPPHAPSPTSPTSLPFLIMFSPTDLLLLSDLLYLLSGGPVDSFGDWVFSVPDDPDAFWDIPLLV